MHLGILLVTVLVFTQSQASLHDKLHYYEIPAVSVHSVTKRSTEATHTKQLEVAAFGKNFTLELRPTKNLFTNDFKIAIVRGDGSQEMVNDFPRDRFMTGHVVGDPNSQASLHVGEDNVVTGMFTANGEEYGIEPLSNHEDGDGDTSHYDKSTLVMYRHKDIKTDPQNSGLCGSLHPDNLTSPSYDDIVFKKFDRGDDHHRHKRAASSENTCMMVAVADFTYYTHFGQSNIFTTANFISNIINRVNLIYRSTVFANVGVGYGFELQLMVIHVEPTTSGNEFYYNTQRNWGTLELLEGFSRTTSYSQQCMALLFTARPMTDSLLGLAYIASPTRGLPGGLCSPQRNINGYQSTLNTGWVTSKNGAGNTLTFTQHSLVTAHELGHGWGSEHDPGSGSCAPGSILDDGKYLMYAYAVTGEDPNNDKFSSCSGASIGAVLANKASGCLTVASVEDPCGNGRIDTGEECDGGLLGKLGLDPCCSQECLLNPGAICSTANYACCVNCLLASNQRMCQGRIEEACTGEAFCDGFNLQCPAAPKLGADVQCLDDGTCVDGVCTPFCEFYGLNSCVCDTVETSCRRCCRDPATGVCSTYGNNLLQDGRSCVQGFCQGGICVKVNSDMIERLWDLVDEISFDFIAEQFRTNMVGCVIGFSLLIYIPVCIIIFIVDWRRKKNWEKENSVHIRRDRNLAHDEDKRPIERPNQARPVSSRPSTLDPSEFMASPHTRKPLRNPNQIQPLDHRVSHSNA